MEPISILELNELFIDTLQHGSSETLSKPDEEVEWHLFEEFDVGVISFLHEKSLSRLLAQGYINNEIKNLSSVLRRKAISLLKGERNVNFARTDKGWAELFKLTDRVLRLKYEFDQTKNAESTTALR